jgi:hypothetical protein
VEKNKLNIDIKILESDSEIQRRLLKALLPDIRKYMNKVINNIKNKLPNIVNSAIKNTPEYDAILMGRLKAEFGIPDPAFKLAGLLDIWSKNIAIEYQNPQISGSQIKSQFSASMIKIDFADVLYSDFAQVIDNERGYSLPWLQWLLLEGNKTLVKNYEVVFGPSPRSRSGLALMTPSKKSWKVPSMYAGTQNDNWITRAIDSAQNDIYRILEDSLQ